MKVRLAEDHAFGPTDVTRLQPLLNRDDVTWSELCGNARTDIPAVVPSYDDETDTVTIEHPYAF